MTKVIALTDSNGTVNLLDDVNYNVQSIFLPLPKPKALYSGDNPMRDGADLAQLTYSNREIQMRLKLMGTSQDHLIAGIRGIYDMLMKAKDAQLRGWGNEVQLQYKWQDPTGTVFFDVLHGDLDLPADFQSRGNILEGPQQKLVLEAPLTLTCRPFAWGALSDSHENYLVNGGFERGTAGTVAPEGWVAYQGTPSYSYVSPGLYGSRALQTEIYWGSGITPGFASNVFTVGSAASTGAFGGAMKHVSGGTDPVLAVVTDVDSGSVLASLSWTNEAVWTKKGITFTKPDAGTRLQTFIYVPVHSGGTITTQCDGFYVNPIQAGTPTFWISDRLLWNHNDADPAHSNILDIGGVEGDVPAGLRIAGVDGELTQRIRKTPGNYTQCYEAESGAIGTAATTGLAGTVWSGGTGIYTANATATWEPATTITVNTNMVDRYGRVRVFVAIGANHANVGTVNMRIGLKYGSTAKYSRTLAIVVGVVGTRRWYDFGVFDLPPQAFIPRDGEVNQWQWAVEFKDLTGGAILVIDNVYVTPLDDGYVMGSGHNVFDSTVEPPGAYMLSTPSDDTSDYSMAVTADYMGVPPMAQPGSATTNRFFYRANTGSATQATIITMGTARAKVRPRYLLVQ